MSQTLKDLIQGGTTRLNLNQIDVFALFDIPRTLIQRGFEEVTESNLSDTLLIEKVNPKFNTANKNELKDIGGKLFEYLNSKNNRTAIRNKIIGNHVDPSNLPDGFYFEPSEANQNRYSKTIEALLAYLCVQELKAFSASFGVNIKGTPSGGDYDCIANFQNSLFYFEVKSGNACNIKLDEMKYFLLRHNFLSPEASVLFLDYQNVPEDVIGKFKGLNINRIIKVYLESKTFYVLNAGIIVADLSKNGDILENIRGAMRFNDKYNSHIKRMMYECVEPKHLGLEGKVLLNRHNGNRK